MESKDLDEAQIEESAQGGLRSLRSAGEWQRRTLFVNCWHEAPHESEAMWRLYAGWKLRLDGSPGGLVVQSTAGRLAAELRKSRPVHVGRVRYVDYSKTLVGINEAAWCKAKSLEHEKEVRALVHHYKGQSGADLTGISFPVDLD